MEKEKLIGQAYWTTKSLREPDTARKIAEYLVLRDDEFKPHVLYGGRITRGRNEVLAENDVDKVVKCFADSNVSYIVLTNRDRKKREVIFGFTFSLVRKFSVIDFGVTNNYFESDFPDRIAKVLDIGKGLAEHVEPMYGRIHDIGDISDMSTTVRRERANASESRWGTSGEGDGLLLRIRRALSRRLKPAEWVQVASGQAVHIFEKIPGAYWGNYFGRYYIDRIGRQKLLSFKGHRVEELHNGDILILTSPGPLTFASTEDRKAQRALASHLGLR